MSCYLCAYQSAQTPRSPMPLPSGSPHAAHDDLGTCSTCAVWACASHGTRYMTFECAICTPASAARQVLLGAPAAAPVGVAAGARLWSPAVALARSAGDRVSGDHREAMDRGLNLITEHLGHPGAPAAAAGGEGLRASPPNLIDDLAGFIRAWPGSTGEAAAVGGLDGSGEGQLEAVAAAVRSTFRGASPVGPEQLVGDRPIREEVVRVLIGALLLAYSVAHLPVARIRAEAPAWPGQVELSHLPAPWLASFPPLLDPVIWLVATALVVSRPSSA